VDFAFVPGTSKYNRMMRTMYSYRPLTTVVNVRGINSIKGFLNHFSTHLSSFPTSILIGPLDNKSGWMNVHIDEHRLHAVYKQKNVGMVYAYSPKSVEIPGFTTGRKKQKTFHHLLFET
jgi:hypothetical protein